ncbi:hypothetical protein POX_h09631 [Penicillium oxalicum]|uniref:Uncharacterized protein n=1 Tax=Penicillium oxalicum (strain 114-2 / CGMCC 5302) TaxID=933388 RepID=S7ZRQ5_PENO1|nr:hypothetical protein POX_h09631 [Penicillium oxalicum]EPS31341.1 hypothetical protein PDE_06296 [Penicillium oxalicum 114-2]KAI2785869.1 hypothetical protein POX_h09631 [Penicillium oxalicum]
MDPHDTYESQDESSMVNTMKMQMKIDLEKPIKNIWSD